MTQQDKWKQRPCVVRYRAWADTIRASMGKVKKVALSSPTAVSVKSYHSMPNSWGEQSIAEMAGRPHFCKPDGDNILKGITDALFSNDEMLYKQSIEKYWDDGLGPRVEISIERG